MKTLLLGLFLMSSAFAQEAQMPIVSPSVEKFLNENDLSELTESCVNFDACSHMNYHVKTYEYKGDAQEAFDLLVSLSPNEIWHGTSRFEMEFDPSSQSFIGKDRELPEITQGQVFFLELDITKKMQIPVAFKVVELDHAKKTLSFSYLKQNKSNGIQRITFVQDGDNFKVVHETHFKSDSKFRDKYLYGFFHTRLLNDVWKNFFKRLPEE